MNLLKKAITAYWRNMRGKSPILAIYYLTYNCNSRCIYCDIWQRDGTMANVDDVMKNLEALARMGIQFISFTGGEPLLFPSLPQVLKKARSLGMWITLITNGIIYEKRAEEIRGLVDDLEFSLSTLRPDHYLKERGVDALSFVLKGIEKALEIGEKVSILTTTFHDNLSDLDEVIAYSRRIGCLCIIGPVYGYFGNDPFPNNEIDILRHYSSQRGVWMNRAFIEFLSRGGNQIGRPRCRALISTLSISPDNRILVPCFHHCIEGIPVSGKLQLLWKEKLFREMKNRVGRWSFCQGCHIFCYFEGSFLWPPDKYFLLDSMSRIRWFIQQRSLCRYRSSGDLK